MNRFKKSYKAIVKYFLQKLLGFSSIMCVFMSLKRRDDPIWYGTLCILFLIYHCFKGGGHSPNSNSPLAPTPARRPPGKCSIRFCHVRVKVQITKYLIDLFLKLFIMFIKKVSFTFCKGLCNNVFKESRQLWPFYSFLLNYSHYFMVDSLQI